MDTEGRAPEGAAATEASASVADDIHAELGIPSGELGAVVLVDRALLIQQEIDELAAVRNDSNKQKKAATKAYRNLEKTRKRLKKKSSALSTKDLVDVLAIRVNNEKVKREADLAKRRPQQLQQQPTA